MEQAELPLGGAEAVLNFQPNTTLPVAYHPLFGSHDDLVLLELDEKLLPEVLDQRVELRGQPDEDAVLCTQTKTFAIKFVGTSNSAFLIPPSGQFATSEKLEDSERRVNDQRGVIPVIKVAPGSMELTEVAPRLDRLKYLLSENPYSSDDASEMEDSENAGSPRKRLYKWDDLTDRVQASDSELRIGLEALSAVEIYGYWRIVDDKYMDTILRMLLHNAVLNDWSLSALNEDEVVSVLVSDGFPHELGLHCLQVYGSKVDQDGGNYVWKLDERRVCVQFAREILRGGKKKLDNFMIDWSGRIPDGMHANLDMLEGEILTEKLGVETWIHSFSVSSLPSTPAERFSILFRERPKWEWKDLQPYIRDLNVPGLSSEGLLLKYTRRSQPTPDAEPIFTARSNSERLSGVKKARLKKKVSEKVSQALDSIKEGNRKIMEILKKSNIDRQQLKIQTRSMAILELQYEERIMGKDLNAIEDDNVRDFYQRERVRILQKKRILLTNSLSLS